MGGGGTFDLLEHVGGVAVVSELALADDLHGQEPLRLAHWVHQVYLSEGTEPDYLSRSRAHVYLQELE